MCPGRTGRRHAARVAGRRVSARANTAQYAQYDCTFVEEIGGYFDAGKRRSVYFPVRVLLHRSAVLGDRRTLGGRVGADADRDSRSLTRAADAAAHLVLLLRRAIR